MVRIFLAHAKEDKKQVLELYDRLKEKGYQPWLDKVDLLPGQNWRTEIPKAIKDSDVFIACFSQQSVKKQGYIQRELRMALNEMADRPPDQIYLIPVRLDKCQVPALRQEEYGLSLTDYQWVNLYEPDGYDRLVKGIETQFSQKKRLRGLVQREQAPYAGIEIGHSGRLPPLLTYDLDRSLQEGELFEKIQDLGPSSPRPVICLIHGNDRECHGKFIDCLEKIGLRRLLGLKQNLAPSRIYIPNWPSQLNELDNFYERYRKSLADHTLGYSRASQQEINDWLMCHPEPVIIELEFLTHNWKQHAEKVVLQVLEFWQSWPTLAPHQVLFVCLSIKYPVQKRALFSKVFGYKPISEVAAASLESLSHTSNKQIILAVLSTLEGVIQDDVERWLHAKEKELLVRFGRDVIDDLQRTIRSMFEQCQSQEEPKRIPMEVVTEQLRSIFRKHSTQREGATV